MKFNFNYQGNEKSLEVKVLKGIFQQARGLMFKKNSKPLLFIFKNSKKRAIHSFFCKSFIAIWFENNKIVDVKTINSWKLSIRPKEKFNQLLEIPNSDIAFNQFLDGENL